MESVALFVEAVNKWGMWIIFPFIIFALYKEWWYTGPYVARMKKELEQEKENAKRWERAAFSAMGVAEIMAKAGKPDN